MAGGEEWTARHMIDGFIGFPMLSDIHAGTQPEI
jgi:hypothetical protein